MKLTNNHKLFYANKKLNVKNDISIHLLINDQIPILNREVYCDKHNDLNLLKMLVKRCNRNNLNLIAEMTKIELSSKGNRRRLFKNLRMKLEGLKW